MRYYPALGQFVSSVSIHSSFLEDLYIVASATESVRQATALSFNNRTTATPTDIKITVTRIPAVSFVWLGVVILVGASLPFVLISGTAMGEMGDERHNRKDVTG